jgi:hypothetical protein
MLHSKTYIVEAFKTLAVSYTENVSQAPNSSEARLTAPMMEVGPPVVSPASDDTSDYDHSLQ